MALKPSERSLKNPAYHPCMGYLNKLRKDRDAEGKHICWRCIDFRMGVGVYASDSYANTFASFDLTSSFWPVVPETTVVAVGLVTDEVTLESSGLDDETAVLYKDTCNY